MNIGGLGAKLAQVKSQKPSKSCDRCGLQHDIDIESCPHCSHLDERSLKALIAGMENEYIARKSMGYRFMIAAAVLALIVVIIAVN